MGNGMNERIRELADGSLGGTRAMSKENIFRYLHNNMVKRDEYLYEVPSDINGFIFDNGYVNSLLDDYDTMLKVIFDEHAEAIGWFLYEWKPGYEVEFDGKTSKIYDIDGYIDWMKSVEGFE
jgi:hypothetical protein